MRNRVIIIAVLLLLTISNFYAQPKDQLTQIATIDALLAGAYDGIFLTEDFDEYGDFGLGTFDKLDGEMIVLNGNIYKVKYDGTVIKNEPTSTPFAAIVKFITDNSFEINGIVNFEKLEEAISEEIQNKNLPAAVKLEGSFEYVKVRSVPEQEKPYKPLAEVTKDQSVFEYENLEGTLIGFYIPAYFKSFNVSGFHLHFLSKDETKGGHLLDVKLNEGNVELDILNKFYVHLPGDSEEFGNIDLEKDRTEELENVER